MNCRGREKHSATLDYVPFHFFRALAASGVLSDRTEHNQKLLCSTIGHITIYITEMTSTTSGARASRPSTVLVKLLIELHVH